MSRHNTGLVSASSDENGCPAEEMTGLRPAVNIRPPPRHRRAGGQLPQIKWQTRLPGLPHDSR
jgi:hypothetical protein